MPAYVVDSSKQPMIATGVVSVVPEWEDKPDGTGRRPTDRQARDEETGMPLWGVEVVYQQVNYGRIGSVVALVTVQATDQPHVTAMGPIGFDALRVEVRVIRATGVLVENWSAERITGAQPAARRGAGATSAEAA